MDIKNFYIYLLALFSGKIEKGLLARYEYVLSENRILKSKQKKRIIFTDAERVILAEKAKKLGKDLKEVATIVRPDILMKWYRELVKKKWDYSDRVVRNFCEE